jgi:hypothetical protein
VTVGFAATNAPTGGNSGAAAVMTDIHRVFDIHKFFVFSSMEKYPVDFK